MTKQEILDRLKVFETNDFKFIEESHKYFLKERQMISVTTLLHEFKKPFDSDYWSKKKAEERGVTQDVILKEWAETNKKSTDMGTWVHNFAEHYFKKEWYPLPTDLDTAKKINKFIIAYAKHLHKLEPLLFEMKLFSKRGIAGMIDCLFLYKGKDGEYKLIMLDYKTNKKWTDDDNNRYSRLLGPFDDQWENHHNEYSIQQSMYSLIIKEETGLEVAAKYLLYIPNENEEAKLIKCKDFEDRIENWLNEQEEYSVF